MIEQNAADGKHVVAFAIVDRQPMGEELRAGVRAAGVENRAFVLGRIRRAKHLAGGRLVEPTGIAESDLLDPFEQTGGTHAGDVAGALRNVEAHAHVALGRQVVDFGGLDVVQELPEATGVGEIPEVQEEAVAVLMQVRVDVIYAARVEAARTSFDAMDFVAFTQKKLCEIRTVLASYTGDECAFHGN